MKKIKPIEKMVISGLDMDGRKPFSRLGKTIRKSQQQVSYTTKTLIKRGIIKGFYPVIDYSKLDVINFRVYFKMSYFNKKNYLRLIDYLIKEPHTSWIASCGGPYDLLCTFFAKNPSQFNKKLKEIMSKFPRQLENYTILTTIVYRKFGLKYLSRKPKKEIIFGGDREPENVDMTDLKIMNELSRDGRKSSTDIAEEVGVTAKTVIDRMRKLNKRRILLGFSPLIEPRKMGYVSGLLLLRYHNMTPEVEDKITMFLKSHPNVTWISKTIGEWDVEVFIHANDFMKLRNIEMRIRQHFSSFIQKTESIPIYENFKKNFFPEFLISNGEQVAD